jgi:NADH-quinone oxidoreductase subunit M
MFFALASLGLPGLGNFVGEFLVLIGTFQTDIILTIVAATGLVFAAIYSLWIIQQTFHGEKRADWKISDLSPRFILIFAVMIIPLVILGLFPQPVIDTAQPAIERLERINTIDKPEYSGVDLTEADRDRRFSKGGD